MGHKRTPHTATRHTSVNRHLRMAGQVEFQLDEHQGGEDGRLHGLFP